MAEPAAAPGPAGEPPVDDDELYRRIAELLGQAVVPGPDTPIAALSVDSFALVELVIEVQDRYGVRFDHDDVRALRTVGDLAGLVRSRASARLGPG